MGRGVGGEGGDGLDTYWYYVDWDLDFMTIVTIMMNSIFLFSPEFS